MSYQPIGGPASGADHQTSLDAPDLEKPSNAGSSLRPKSWLPFSTDFSPALTHTLISVAAGTVMQGVFGGIIIGGEFNDYFAHPAPGMVGFVTSVYDLGCFGGAILTLGVGERLGRKRMLVVFTVIMASGIVLQTCAQNMQHLLWGRLIAGIGNGGNTATAPVWHVETSHAEAKGKAVVKEMVVNVFGFVVSNIVTLAFSHIDTEAQWRFPLGIQLLFIVVILALVPLLPESPRWLLARGRDSEAKQVMQMLSEHSVEEEFNELRTSVKEEMAVEATWAQIFRGGTNTRRLLLGMLLQVCQQLSGINVLCYYLPLVLHKSVGLDEDPSHLLATGIAFIFALATAGSLFTVERFGRRKLLIAMAAVMSISFLGISISTEIGHGGNFSAGVVATVFMTFYFIAFGAAWVSIPWLYPAEVNSLSYRTKGAALATACDWLFNYVVVQTTPLGIHYLKWGLYLVYAVLNALFIPIIYYFVVETAGLSLEQIDRWFAENPGWLVHKAQQGVFGKDANGSIEHHANGAIVLEERQALVDDYEHEARRRADSDARKRKSYDRHDSLDEGAFALGEDSEDESEDGRLYEKRGQGMRRLA